MIYLASPYSAPNKGLVQIRFDAVEQQTALLLKNRMSVYSPIVHCHALADKYDLPTDAKFWQNYNYDMVERVDALWILTIDGWFTSLGVQGEVDHAFACGIPVFTNNPGELTTQQIEADGWPQ